jgi:hypothetical protein
VALLEEAPKAGAVALETAQLGGTTGVDLRTALHRRCHHHAHDCTTQLTQGSKASGRGGGAKAAERQPPT